MIAEEPSGIGTGAKRRGGRDCIEWTGQTEEHYSSAPDPRGVLEEPKDTALWVGFANANYLESTNKNVLVQPG